MKTTGLTIGTHAAAFRQQLVQIIPPKSLSDQTAFRHVAVWLANSCRQGAFTTDIFARVLDLAQEAAGPDCRNPAAVFMSLLKKELCYKPHRSPKGGPA